MDLGFSRFDKDMVVTTLPADLAVLLVGVAARQAGSPTAANYARLLNAPVEPTLLAPLHGAFNGPVAARQLRWKEE
ncbi:conserved hypothetical protein [Sphingomonas sp. EC-HK361]|uniref:hypothetical protein n=1 Tax=Sphingomonas sp. EC-HK361 TaxID=2038397 RepID=UPI00125A3FC0|nr:hypothetical protein [Sphingomonas sp. EC-HK361]VVT15304.1 conserved hypothetical protein [Sphingomonas sp. EC-HK361]